MRTFHAYHKEENQAHFEGEHFYTSKSISPGDILFVIIGKKSGMNGQTQYFLDGKFRVDDVKPNTTIGSHAKKKTKLQLTPLKRASHPICFSEMPGFDKKGYRDYFISTGGFKEMKPEKNDMVALFNHLLDDHSKGPLPDKDDHVRSDDYAISDGTDEPNTDKRVLREIWARRGQPRFRNSLLGAYNGRCCITGSAIVELLEAAHIDPHSDGGDYSVINGLLLRSDIHTLFDQHLLTVDEYRVIHLSKSLMDSEYKKYHGETIELPHLNAAPSGLALGRRHAAFLEKERCLAT